MDSKIEFPRPTETIMEDAEVTAIYFRALLMKGIPTMIVANLTGSYISTYQVIREQRNRPKDPWEKDA